MVRELEALEQDKYLPISLCVILPLPRITTQRGPKHRTRNFHQTVTGKQALESPSIDSEATLFVSPNKGSRTRVLGRGEVPQSDRSFAAGRGKSSPTFCI